MDRLKYLLSSIISDSSLQVSDSSPETTRPPLNLGPQSNQAKAAGPKRSSAKNNEAKEGDEDAESVEDGSGSGDDSGSGLGEEEEELSWKCYVGKTGNYTPQKCEKGVETCKTIYDCKQTFCIQNII